MTVAVWCIIAVLLFVACIVATLHVLFRSVGGVEAPWVAGAPTGVVTREDVVGLGASCLLAERRRHGFLPTYLEIVLSGDPRYTLRAMCEDVWRDPDVRWLVILGMLPQLLLPCRRLEGLSYRLRTSGTHGGRMYSTYFNVLVAEQLLKYLTTHPVKVSDGLGRLLHELVTEIVAAARLDPRSTGHLYNFTEDPRISNRFLCRIMQQWVQCYDADDTFLALSLLGKYQDACFSVRAASTGLAPVEGIERVVGGVESVSGLLRQLVLPATKGILPSERHLVGDGVKALGTYFTSGANDVDPTVNVNILESLVSNTARWRVVEKPYLVEVAHIVLSYLCRLGERGLLLSRYQHQYYSQSAFTFFWKRLSRVLSGVPQDVRALLDPERSLEYLNGIVDRYWSTDLKNGEANRHRLNTLDLLLLSHAYPEHADRLWPALSQALSSGPIRWEYEFFCVLYPVKNAYASKPFLASLLLNLPDNTSS
jgi:hypothetical protein